MKSQHVAILAFAGAAILLPILFCGLMAINLSRAARSVSKGGYTTVAETKESQKKVTLYSDDDDAGLFVFKNRQVYDKWRENNSPSNIENVLELSKDGAMFYVPNDTTAVIVKDFNDLTIVRIASGTSKGKVGFVKTSWIKD